MSELTELQKQVCRFIRQFAADNGYAPSRQEIAGHFGWKSGNAAETHVQALLKKGAVSRVPHSSRTLRVLVDV